MIIQNLWNAAATHMLSGFRQHKGRGDIKLKAVSLHVINVSHNKPPLAWVGCVSHFRLLIKKSCCSQIFLVPRSAEARRRARRSGFPPQAHCLTWPCCQASVLKVAWQSGGSFCSTDEQNAPLTFCLTFAFLVLKNLTYDCGKFSAGLSLSAKLQNVITFNLTTSLSKFLECETLILNCGMTQMIWYNTAVVILNRCFTEFQRELHSSPALSALLLTSTSLQIVGLGNSQCSENKINPGLVKLNIHYNNNIDNTSLKALKVAV